MTTAIPPSIYDVLNDIGPMRTIVEIGAHHMQDTVKLRAMSPDARIIAFEPDPRNLQVIANAGTVAATGAELHGMAVGDVSGPMSFFLSTNRTGKPEKEWTASSSLRHPTRFTPPDFNGTIDLFIFDDKPITVQCTTLDDFFLHQHDMPLIDLIWCDAQGAEDLIIKGAPKTFARTKYFFCEHNTTGYYVGAPTITTLTPLLPGWKMLHCWPYDAFFCNETIL